MANINSISGAALRDMFLMGAALLEKNKALIDSLNVFPVPDGDTGTNMSMTMQGAAKELRSLADNVSAGVVAKAASIGSLKSARGNSGVILSQIFRGFSKEIGTSDEVTPEIFAKALSNGTASAYKAVMKPKEGTMLTVSRMLSEAVMTAYEKGADIGKLVEVMIESGDEAVKITPELLPVLKEAGVVDSGGKGLMTVLRGFKLVLDGESIEDYENVAPKEEIQSNADITLEDVNDIKFGYCTEFFIIHLSESFSEKELDAFRDKIMSIGDSVVVAHDTGFVKVHVHSNMPGKILQLAMQLGELDKIKIENMREQNRQLAEDMKKNEKEIAFIAVSSGSGIDAIFNDLGASGIISGGQTMNPSIETIGNAITRANARNVIVLPNNSNIILAAQQAAELAKCNVKVIPSRNIMQGISAAISYDESASADENEQYMTEAMEGVNSGSVTYAVRNTSYNGTHIEEGNLIGLLNNKIEVVGTDIEEVSLDLMRKLVAMQPDEPTVTVLYGEDVTEEAANTFTEKLQAEFPDAEITVQSGGQPLYYYLFSVE
ncbi:MAG: DAK2 domain-containing protein [Clostridia bacterium]|nr:DAK2 domain-containing protein [Clostridia bacterium]